MYTKKHQQQHASIHHPEIITIAISATIIGKKSTNMKLPYFPQSHQFAEFLNLFQPHSKPTPTIHIYSEAVVGSDSQCDCKVLKN